MNEKIDALYKLINMYSTLGNCSLTVESHKARDNLAACIKTLTEELNSLLNPTENN